MALGRIIYRVLVLAATVFFVDSVANDANEDGNSHTSASVRNYGYLSLFNVSAEAARDAVRQLHRDFGIVDFQFYDAFYTYSQPVHPTKDSWISKPSGCFTKQPRVVHAATIKAYTDEIRKLPSGRGRSWMYVQSVAADESFSHHSKFLPYSNRDGTQVSWNGLDGNRCLYTYLLSRSWADHMVDLWAPAAVSLGFDGILQAPLAPLEASWMPARAFSELRWDPCVASRCHVKPFGAMLDFFVSAIRSGGRWVHWDQLGRVSDDAEQNALMARGIRDFLHAARQRLSSKFGLAQTFNFVDGFGWHESLYSGGRGSGTVEFPYWECWSDATEWIFWSLFNFSQEASDRSHARGHAVFARYPGPGCCGNPDSSPLDDLMWERWMRAASGCTSYLVLGDGDRHLVNEYFPSGKAMTDFERAAMTMAAREAGQIASRQCAHVSRAPHSSSSGLQLV
ncbi:unnamed protein product [Prorocentrum cordatum]|uniref:Uncharacterized protein n=1 Tax=Prorocentrum cordatum TaxID=2364126 RepID=A0ABN9RVK3_9DINO|nr:unnamed protein product [Polarella glacialis]